eukprot:maker-scaffold_71-snap-gene-0.2-mRNA-1 protein AED:0.14 eAED:0.14 QI:0/0/0.5/1/1/1/2/35/281
MSEKINGNGTAQKLKEEGTKKFNEALERTKKEVENVQAKLKEFDDSYQATETLNKQREKASEFLKTSLDEAKESLEKVGTSAHGVFQSGKENTAEIFAKAVAKFKEAVEEVFKKAKEYDEKYHITETVSSYVDPIKERIQQLIKELLNNLSMVTTTINSRIEESLKQTKEYLLKSAASLDNKYDIETKVTTQLDKISKTAKNLDEKFKVQELLEKAYEKGKELDLKMTQGKAGSFVEGKVSEGYHFVSGEVEKLYKDFDTAKRSSRENLLWFKFYVHELNY